MASGIDTVDYSEKTGDLVVTLSTTHATTVTVNGVAEDTIDEFENVNGGSGNDRIIGSEVHNVLSGNGGNDVLDGRAGADWLIGGAGNDTYIVDNSGDVVDDAAGQGNDTVFASISFVLSANVENVTLTGKAAIDATGNSVANTLVGNAAANRLDGGGGADLMKGGASDDTYVVDNAMDKVVEVAGEGHDTVQSSVSHVLSAEVEDLALLGTSDIAATGNALANAITGNAGDNTIAGGLGIDFLTGGAGGDSFVFDVKAGKKNADTILDFSVGDKIVLDTDVFGKLRDDGVLKAKFFAFGKADDGNDYVTYKEGSGKLLYDQDGDGGKGAKLIAILKGGPDLDGGDILLV
jgi:Ca2+-binding RTX toxin-like protein